MSCTTTRINQKNQAHRHEILHVQQLQSDEELKIHKVSTENNPSDLMTKYLETVKIKKHTWITSISWQPQHQHDH
eukprot:5994389-Amphidinium_carterae.1